MSFLNSVLTTLGIVFVVWGAVFLTTSQYSESSNATPSPVTDVPEMIRLVGLQKDVNLKGNLDEVEAVWKSFYESSDLHISIEQNSSKRVYAYYEFSDKGVSRAKLFIGYHSKGNAVEGFSLSPRISASGYELISENNDSWDTTSGWDEINPNREASSILEEYVLGRAGERVASKVYILYQ